MNTLENYIPNPDESKGVIRPFCDLTLQKTELLYTTPPPLVPPIYWHFM